MNYDEIKKQLCNRIDELVEAIGNGKTIEIRLGKNELQLFEVKKKIVKPNKETL